MSIYLISGPCGTGKSTVSKLLAEDMERTACLQGDHIMEMISGNQDLPWEKQLDLVWRGIVVLTHHFLGDGMSVVIDYVVEDELEWFCQQFPGVSIHYIVLHAEEDRLIERLKERETPDLIDRSLFLLKQLTEDPLNHPFLFDTTYKQPSHIAKEIRNHITEFRKRG